MNLAGFLSFPRSSVGMNPPTLRVKKRRKYPGGFQYTGGEG